MSAVDPGPKAPAVERGLSLAVLSEPTSEVWKYAWSVTEALIERMAIECGMIGVRFALVFIPAPIQVRPTSQARERLATALGVEDLSYCDRRLARLGERVGFPVVELTSRMEAEAVANGIHLHGFENTAFGTGHWNEEGHALAAEIIADRLRQAGILP